MRHKMPEESASVWNSTRNAEIRALLLQENENHPEI